MKNAVCLAVLIIMLAVPSAARSQSSQTDAEVDSRSLQVILSSFSKNLADISAKLRLFTTELSDRDQDRQLEHVLIVSELLLIKTIINYENKLNQTTPYIRSNLKQYYYQVRIQDLQNSKEKLKLSLGRVKRHAANLVKSVRTRKKQLDAEGLLMLNDVQHTVEKVLVLFDMSIDYFQSAVARL